MNRKSPFPFNEQTRAVMKSYQQDAREKFETLRETFIDGQNVYYFSHGTSWQSHNSFAPDRVSQLQSQSHDSYIRLEDLAIGRLEVISESLDSLANSMFEGFSRSLIKTMTQVCEENDRVVSNTGSHAEQLAAAIESVEFSVGRDGAVRLPQIMLGTQAIKSFLRDPDLRTTEMEARMQAITARKTAQAMEREAARKAKFMKGEE